MIVNKDQTMKSKLLAISAVMILITSATTNAGDSFLKKFNRYLGYGISDGYHAQRYCQPACTSCNSCSPLQQPMTMSLPMTTPAYSQYAPYRLQYVGHPVAPLYRSYAPGYVNWRARGRSSPDVARMYHFYALSYGQPMIPALANPHRGPALRW